MSKFYLVSKADPFFVICQTETGFITKTVDDYSKEADRFSLEEIDAISQWVDLCKFRLVKVEDEIVS